MHRFPDSKVHGANMGPSDGPHVGPMNFAIWEFDVCFDAGLNNNRLPVICGDLWRRYMTKLITGKFYPVNTGCELLQRCVFKFTNDHVDILFDIM